LKTHRWMPLALALLMASPARAERWIAIEKVPDASPIRLLVRGKERIYFRVTADKPLAVSVVGPGQVRLTTRVELPAGAQGSMKYRVKVTEGEHALDQLSTESAAADSVSVPGSPLLAGRSRTLAFNLPAGTHRLAIATAGASAVMVRIQKSGKAGDVPMVSLTPIFASRSVAVVEGEKTIPYYTVLPGKPVQLRVVGPTSFELLSRLDFDNTMRGTATYTLRIVEKGRTLRETEFTTTKATTASYTNLSDRVPSKFDRMRVELPDGLHEISVELVRPTHGSAEIHARIPQPSVGNQE
jgi:hypothetical protein